MRALQVVQFGLFLILLGFSVMLFADLVIAIGVISLFGAFTGGGMESALFSAKVMAWGFTSLLIGYTLGGLGKFLCVGAPESGARNLILLSVLSDVAVIALHFSVAQGYIDSFVSYIFIYVLSLISYFTFLKFLTRMGDNVGEPRVGRYVSIIYGGIGGGFVVWALIFISFNLFLLALCGLVFISIFLYNYTIYTLFRAMPLYMEEVRLGFTDPKESAQERLERERKERLKGPGGGGVSPTRPPEEPTGPPPEGAKLYRIPKALEPLHLAVKEGDRYKVELRLAQGDQPNQKVKHGLTPLHIAASGGVMDVADALLKAGADVDATCETGLTPLYFAVQTGNPNIVGFFLSKGADIHHKNEHGYTPLHWACSAPHPNFVGPTRVKMVELLIGHGADLKERNQRGQTPRELALENGLEEVVSAIDRHLVAPSSRPSFQQLDSDSDGAGAGEPARQGDFTPFQGVHLSVMPGDLPPFHAAVKEGDPEKIQRQIQEGADINARIEGGIAPIHITSITGVMSGSQLLLQLGANVNDVCDHGLTPLFLAVHLNNVNMVGYLISRGADLHHQDSLGRTPLHWAAAAPHEKLEGQNRVKMVEFLLERGADPGIRDKEGRSPQDLARAAGHDEVLKLFGEDEAVHNGGDDDDDYYV